MLLLKKQKFTKELEEKEIKIQEQENRIDELMSRPTIVNNKIFFRK